MQRAANGGVIKRGVYKRKQTRAAQMRTIAEFRLSEKGPKTQTRALMRANANERDQTRNQRITPLAPFSSKEAKIPQPLLIGEYGDQKLKPLFTETKATFSLETGRKRETETKN